MSIIVKVHNGYFYSGKEHAPIDGQVSVIPARSSASYEIVEQLTGKAPKTIKVEKRGADLALSVDEDSTADIIIQGFFLHPDSQVVGLGDDGSYYSYLPNQSEYENLFGKEFSYPLGKKLNPLTWYEKYFGDDNATEEAQAPSDTASSMQTMGLYSYGKATPWLIDAKSEPMGNLLKPVLGVIGLSGLVLLGIENAKGDEETTPPPTPPSPPARPTAEINDAGTEVKGEATAGSTVRVFNGNTVLGSSTANSDGQYTVKLSNTPTNGETLRVNAVKDGSAASLSATVSAPDTTKPEPATEVKINDAGTQVTGKAEAGATVNVLDEFGNVLGTAGAAANGNFSINLLVPQTTAKPLTVVVSDAAKNTSDAVKLTGASGTNTIVSAPRDIDPATNAVAENAATGTQVGLTVKSTDFEAVTYTLTNNAGGKFTIDTNSGVVTLASAVDFETARSHQVTARATSADGSFREQSFTIQVTNVNDNKVSAITDSNNNENKVSSNAAVGESVGITASASDADGDRVTYSLKNSSGKFSINADTGEIFVAQSLSNDSGTLSVQVAATSADGSSSEQTFSVSIGAVTQSRPMTLSALNETAEPAEPNTQTAARPVSDSLVVADISQLLLADSTPII